MRAIALTFILLASLVPLAPGATAASFTVSASNFAWTPNDLTIAPGDSVTFSNAGGSHNWVRDDAPDSCTLPCTRTFASETLVEYHCGIHPSMTGTVLVAAPVVVTITSPAAGATVSGIVHVTGTAAHASDIASVSVSIGATSVAATLAGAGGSVSWSADVPTSSVANGPATIVARAETVDAREGSASIGVTVSNAPRVDLRVASVTPQSNAIRGNVVTFVVANDGNALSPASVGRGEYFYEGQWHAFGETSVGPIPAGGSLTFSVTWSPTVAAIGAFDVRVTVDPDALLPDVERADNARVARGAFVTVLVDGVIVP